MKVSGASEIKGVYRPPFRDGITWGHRRQRHNNMCSRHKHCHWVGHVATINPADGGEGSYLASTAATMDMTVKTSTSVAAAATAARDESCAKAATANDKAAIPD